MYVRPPSNTRSELKIPENYSGSAFSRAPQHPDMPPPLRTQPPRHDAMRADIPPEDIDRGRDMPREEAFETDNEMRGEKRIETSQLAGASIFSSLLPKVDIASHFPFGHGIGSEELLILAVMLLVFLSGNERGELDSEFLLLLGLLLFAG